MHLTNVKGSISRLEKDCRCSLSLLDFQRWQVYFWEKEIKKGEDRLKKNVRVFFYGLLYGSFFFMCFRQLFIGKKKFVIFYFSIAMQTW